MKRLKTHKIVWFMKKKKQNYTTQLKTIQSVP